MQTLKIKISSRLSLVVFVLITFELSLCTAGSLFPISLFLTLLLIRKENQEWQSHLFPRPFPPNPTKSLKTEINEVAESFSSWVSYSVSSSVWPQSLLCPGTTWCYFCQSVFLRCHSLFPLHLFKTTLSKQNLISKTSSFHLVTI